MHFTLFLLLISVAPFVFAKTISYEPQGNHPYTYCYSHPPVLHISPGDTIESKTIDAVNNVFDTSDKTIFPKVELDKTNPQTGPFYIDGAERGDTLVVHINKVVPNRDWGWGASIPYFGALAPEYKTAMITEPAPDILYIWNFDSKKTSATVEFSHGKVTIPLNPFLGTIGVAPDQKECIRSVTPANHGGNMDSNQLVSGTTLYFPVFEPGALLMFGDGHAAQGDGEMHGSGIETSMDVSLTVDLIKGKTISMPRAMNDEYIMSLGSTRPLMDAVRLSCVDMISWLVEDYNFDKIEAAQLLGQSVDLEIGNIVDPNHTVACKIKREYLK